MSVRLLIIKHMFDARSADELIGAVEGTVHAESRLMAERMSAVASLLWIRTEEAGESLSSLLCMSCGQLIDVGL